MAIYPIVCVSNFTIFCRRPFDLPLLHNRCISSIVSLSPLSSFPVLAEKQQEDPITSEECRDDPSDAVEVQRGNSPEVQSKTADVRKHEFVEESNLLTGKQTTPHPCACDLLYSGA